MRDHELPGVEPTQTIDLEQLGLNRLSETGSFVISELESTSFGKLLHGLPMPVMLLDMPEPLIHFANGAMATLVSYWPQLRGRSLYDLFRLEEIGGVQRALNKLWSTRKNQAAEAWIGTREKRRWIRMHFQALRMVGRKLALLVIENLSHEKEELNKKTVKLEQQNEILRREIDRRVAAEAELKNKKRSIEKALWDTIGALAKVSEMRDPYTAGHQRRVTQLARAISDKMDVGSRIKTMITLAAGVHDIGKVRVPHDIVSKPGELDTHEFGILRRHPGDGYEALKGLQLPWQIAEAVYQHHERLNGDGYPRGLKGDDIILEARIIGVADVVEAMSSRRPHRPALPLSDAIEEIVTHKGELYDPVVVDACVEVVEGGFAFKEARSTAARSNSSVQ